MRSGSNAERRHSPGCFYPILISSDKKHFCGAGDPLPKDADVSSYSPPEGTIALFPIHKDGTEGVWQYSKSRFLDIQKKGYARISTQTSSGLTVRYISEGWQKKVESGQVKVIGKAEDGSLLFNDEDYVKVFIPSNQWWIPSHDATEFGSKLLQKFIGKRFSYPKSLYAVHDTIRFFVAEKPNAIIVDFFAGSGTTQHAINLLNAEDGGNRRCIMVTNNEISEAEEKEFTKRGLSKGTKEWEAHGIARYVTWPRTKCSIEGKDIKGKALLGNYYGTDLAMADGFSANVKYFKCDWTPRKPEDYLLSNILCLHIKEMIELQNAIEIDNERNVLLLNKSDVKRFILNDAIYEKIEHAWVNQNIVLNAEELRRLEAKGFKYIPKEFFGQEIREAAE